MGYVLLGLLLAALLLLGRRARRPRATTAAPVLDVAGTDVATPVRRRDPAGDLDTPGIA